MLIRMILNVVFNFLFLCTILVDKSWCSFVASKNKVAAPFKPRVLKGADQTNATTTKINSNNKTQEDGKR